MGVTQGSDQKAGKPTSIKTCVCCVCETFGTLAAIVVGVCIGCGTLAVRFEGRTAALAIRVLFLLFIIGMAAVVRRNGSNSSNTTPTRKAMIRVVRAADTVAIAALGLLLAFFLFEQAVALSRTL